MYRYALVALDRYDEPGTSEVLDRVKQIAGATGCKVHLVFVRPLLPTSYSRHLPPNWDNEDQRDSVQWLSEKANEAGLAADNCEVSVQTGSVAKTVVALAEEVRADLIVVGAHKFGLGQLILGSNTNAIARDAHVDVLVVRPKA